jgi:hypothetical protein
MEKIKTDYDSFEALNYSLAKELLTSPKGLVFNDKGDEEEKYQQVRDLIEEKNVQRLSMFLEHEKPFYWQKDYPKMVLMQNLIMGNWISRKNLKTKILLSKEKPK